MRKQGRMLSNKEQRVEWLLKHQHLLSEDIKPHFNGKRIMYQQIVLGMKADGLLAKSTYWPDCISGINEAVMEARHRLPKRADGRLLKIGDEK